MSSLLSLSSDESAREKQAEDIVWAIKLAWLSREKIRGIQNLSSAWNEQKKTRNGIWLTSEEKETLLDLSDLLTGRFIAKLLDFHESVISGWRDELERPAPERNARNWAGRKPNKTEDEIRAAIKLADQIGSIQAQKETGVSPPSIVYWRKKLGISSKLKRGRPRVT